MTDRPPTREPLQLIVFDFDGTLCDSADVKTDAFYALYLDDHGPAVAQAVKDHHLANVGVSRYDKIRHVETEMLGNDPSEEEVCSDRRAVFAIWSRMRSSPHRSSTACPSSSAEVPGSRSLRGRVGYADRRAATYRRPQGPERILRGGRGQPPVEAGDPPRVPRSFADGPSVAVMVGDQPSDAEAARAVGFEGLMIAPPAAWVEPVRSRR